MPQIFPTEIADRLSVLIARRPDVPRYTSYPTAPHFRPADGDTNWREWLGKVPDGTPLSLYLHVPYCRTMCWYCGCATQVAKGDEAVGHYVDALLAEIALTAQYLPAQALVAHIHWGGGTPTIIGAAGLQRVTDRLAALFSFDPSIEIAVEVDPRRFDADLAQGFAACGVNRASLGVQSLDPVVQQAINRIQPLADICRSLDLLRRAGVGSLNFDILYGLPRQSEGSLADTIEQAAALRPDRMALFGYAHVPWMRAHQKRIETAELPDRDLRMRQFLLAETCLNDAGYTSIGLDHFALPDDPLAVAAREHRLHRNFQGYTTDSAGALIGFGASAIGQVSEGYAANIRGVAAWRRKVATGALPVERMLVLSVEDRMRGAVIAQLMCNLRVDLDAVARRFGLPAQPLHDDIAALQPAAEAGLVEIDGGVVTVAPEGRLLLRHVCSAFDRYLPSAAGIRHAAA